jgi:general secretion pathway protein D
VVKIRHGSAKDISEVVKKIIGEQRKQEDRVNSYKLAQQEAQRTVAAAPPPPRLTNAAGRSDATPAENNPQEAQEMHFSSSLAIEHDERSNSIIVYGTPTDILQVKSIVSRLDVLLDQVRIEVVIAQVTLTKTQRSGMEAFGAAFTPTGASSSGASADSGSAADGEASASASVGGSGRGSEVSYNLSGPKSIFTMKGALRNFSLDSSLSSQRLILT